MLKIPYLIIFLSFFYNSFAKEDSHKKMIEYLFDFNKVDTFPDNFGMHSSKDGIRYFYNQFQNEKNQSDILLKLASQYLSAGYIDSAMSIYNQLSNKDSLFLLKGIAEFRRAELNNCIEYHNNQSCIMPFNQKSFHKNELASLKSINYLKKALLYDSTDFTAKWILNISYMTIGKYPKEVPKEYLLKILPKSKIKDIVPFENVAGLKYIDHVSYYGAAAIEDFNNDGFMDICSSSGNNSDNVRLWLGDKNFNFTEVTESSNINGITGGVNMYVVDFNNDGYKDLYIVRGGWYRKLSHHFTNSLLKNNGDNTFKDITFESGFTDFAACHSATWADFNSDGLIDVFIGYENYPSKLYINLGNDRFVDMTSNSNIFVNAFVKGVISFDFNNDKKQDIYISIYGSENILLQNISEGTQIKFKDVSEKMGVQFPIRSFSVMALDYNNDGWEDLFVPNYYIDNLKVDLARAIDDRGNSDKSKLYLNNKGLNFISVTNQDLTDKSYMPMGLNFLDANNDGWLDIYLGTGAPELEALVPNRLFTIDSKTLLFKDVTEQSNVGHLQKTHGIAIADIDNDGDEDMYVNIGGFLETDNFTNALFLNKNFVNDYIKIKLNGKNTNKLGIGSKVKITTATQDNQLKYYYRTLNSGGSYGSSALLINFNIPKFEKLNSAEIHWQNSDSITHIYNPKINMTHTIDEP